MRATTLALLALTLLAATSVAQAQSRIYKTTDEQGNVVFTDQPPSDPDSSEVVELSTTNTTPATPTVTPVSPSAANDSGAPAAAPDPVVTITSPENETTIPMGGGDFGVFASVEPALADGQSLQLFIDGEPWGTPQAGGAWQLSNVFRGAHDLTVKLLDDSGDTLSESGSIKVYVMRPSVLN